ncbi:Holliday junction resolvase RuvX [Croceiramulus getboli]|nr:Holliday junction resolvase RuvX [Flavobacteriaceae bacterium YJPT1-3]
MARIMAIDFGMKRCGLAVTDELQLIASGLTTVPTTEIMDFLTEYLKEEKVDVIVLGAPKRMNNEVSAVEENIVRFRESLTAQFPEVKIDRQDERFTSKMAFQTMIDGGLGKKKRKNKALVDQISATLILQGYLTKNTL